MTNLKQQETDEILKELSELKKEIIAIDTTSEGVRMYNKLSDIEKRFYRYKMFSQMNMAEEAEAELDVPEFTEAELEQFKKYTIKVKDRPGLYIWRTEPGACEECQALDGTIYTNLNEIPPKPHPNCKCSTEKITAIILEPEYEDEADDKLAEILRKLKELIERIKNFIKQQVRNKIIEEGVEIPADYWGKAFKTKSEEDLKAAGLKRLSEIKDYDLRRFIQRKYKVDLSIPVFEVKPKHDLYKSLLNSRELKNFINKYYNDIKAGKYSDSSISYVFEQFDLKGTIHKCEIYHPHIDEDGNIIFTIVDLYDFENLPSQPIDYEEPDSIFPTLNNIAVWLQNNHLQARYVIIIPMKIPVSNY